MQTPVELWAAVVGILLPAVVSMLTQTHWSARAKSITMLIVVLVTTSIGTAVEGTIRPVTLMDWFSALCVIFVATVTTYRHVWRPTGAAEMIETTINPGPAEEVEPEQPATDPV